MIYKFLMKTEESAIHWYCSKCNTVVGKVIKNMTKISKRQDKMEKRLDDFEDKTYEGLGVVKADLEKLKETVTSMPRENDVKEIIKLEIDEVKDKVHDEFQMKMRKEFNESADTLRNHVEELVNASVKGKLDTDDQDKW